MLEKEKIVAAVRGQADAIGELGKKPVDSKEAAKVDTEIRVYEARLMAFAIEVLADIRDGVFHTENRLAEIRDALKISNSRPM